MSENIARVEGRSATLEGKLAGFQATLDAMKTQNIFIGILLNDIGLAIAAGSIMAKLVRLLGSGPEIGNCRVGRWQKERLRLAHR